MGIGLIESVRGDLRGALVWSPAFVHGLRLVYADRVDESRVAIEEQLERAGERGDEEARAYCLYNLAELEWRAGRWATAVERAEEALELVEQSGLEQNVSGALFARALICASLGRVVEARADAERGIALSEAVGDETFRIENTIVLGILELSLGSAALHHARTVEGHLTRIYEKLGVRSRTELAHRLPTPAR